MTEPRDPFEQWLLGQHSQPLAPRPGDFDRISRAARRRRWVRAAGTSVTVFVVIAGLLGVVTALRVAADGAAVPSDTASVPVTPIQPDPSGPTSVSPSPATSQTQPAAHRCEASQLALTVTPGDSAAGHIGLTLVFTNTSSQACTLDGYPVVTFVHGPSGVQVNNPAQPSPAQGPPTLIHLAAGGRAHAALLLANVANYPASTCKPTQVAGVHVHPPDDPNALYASSAQQICSITGTGVAQVYPIRTGG
jgi:Protein of unknown function (DUF4232)